jgi:hypothetical protein
MTKCCPASRGGGPKTRGRGNDAERDPGGAPPAVDAAGVDAVAAEAADDAGAPGPEAVIGDVGKGETEAGVADSGDEGLGAAVVGEADEGEFGFGVVPVGGAAPGPDGKSPGAPAWGLAAYASVVDSSREPTRRPLDAREIRLMHWQMQPRDLCDGLSYDMFAVSRVHSLQGGAAIVCFENLLLFGAFESHQL